MMEVAEWETIEYYITTLGKDNFTEHFRNKREFIFLRCGYVSKT